MKKVFNFILLTLIALSLVAGSSPAWAKKGEGHKNGGPHETPPGWSQGKKKGWHGGGVPPGLQKKKEAHAKKAKSVKHPKKTQTLKMKKQSQERKEEREQILEQLKDE